MIGPLSTPSSTKWTVTPATFTPCSSACSMAPRPGKAGSSAGWTFTIRPAKRRMNPGVSSSMKPARTTSSTPRSSSQPASASSRRARSGSSASEKTAVSMPAPFARSSPRASARLDATPTISSVRVAEVVDQRLKVRPLSGYEHCNPKAHAAMRSTG